MFSPGSTVLYYVLYKVVLRLYYSPGEKQVPTSVSYKIVSPLGAKEGTDGEKKHLPIIDKLFIKKHGIDR
jgi:hypothetical protein